VIAQKAQDTPQERVRVLQRKLYRAAKDAPQRTFGVLYDVYAKLVNFLRRKHKRRGGGVSGVPPRPSSRKQDCINSMERLCDTECHR